MIQRYAQFYIFKKGPGTSFSTTFCVWFFKKNFSIVAFYYLTKFHCLIGSTSPDIGQYMDYNYLLTRMWRHKIWNYPYLFNQAVSIHDEKLIFWERKQLLKWNKKNFSSFLKGFHFPTIVYCLKPDSAPLNLI